MIRKKTVAMVKVNPNEQIEVNHIWAEGAEIYSLVARNPNLGDKQPFIGFTFPAHMLDDVIEALHTARRLK